MLSMENRLGDTSKLFIYAKGKELNNTVNIEQNYETLNLEQDRSLTVQMSTLKN